MDTKKRKTGKKIAFAAVVLLLAAALAALPFFLDAHRKESTKASLLSAEAERGVIEKSISGTGTITEQDAVEISVPQGVRVTEYLVANGQLVREGDAVARVDKVSVMETISTVREAMTETAEELESARSESGTATMTAPAAAKVKAVYAAAGDSVQKVMLEHGALAVLSLDGLMSTSFPCDRALSIGDTVTVVLSDGKEVSGRVESAREAVVTVTISDAFGSIGETVQILDAEGESLGSGSLEVHSAWKAMGTGGTVSRVSIAEGRNVYNGSILFTISANENGYAKLLAEYQSYEEVMEQLFRLYEDGVLKAPCDGCVSGVDESLLQPLAAASGQSSVQDLTYSGGHGSIQFLVNTSSGVSIRFLGDETGGEAGGSGENPGEEPSGESHVYRVGMITAVDENGICSAMLQSWNYTEEQESYYTSADSMTQPYAVPQWVTDGRNLTPGDVFVLVFDSDDALTELRVIAHNELPTPEPSPEDPGGGQPGAGIQMPSGGAGGGFGGFSGGAQEAEKERYSTVGTTMLSITPQETVTVSITLDELDILSVHVGQRVQLTLDALPGQAFSGVISEINTTASNEGGDSKYSAVVALERTDLMLGGMNVSAKIVVEHLDDALLIPSAALIEQDGQTMVYTACDPKTQTLSEPVPVEIGLSDGETVQILSGLNEGDTVWYMYYDTLEVKGLI